MKTKIDFLNRTKSFYILILVALEIFLIIVCMFHSQYHKIEPNHNLIRDAVDMTEGWYDKEGKPVALEPFISNENLTFGEEFVMYYDLGEDIKAGQSMCFRSLSTDFEAYIGDKLIIKPTYHDSRFSCESTGSQWHFYRFEEEDMGKTIEVKLKLYYNDTSSYFENVLACDAHEYVINAINARVSEMIIAVAIIAIGLFIILIGIYSKVNMKVNQNLLITLGMFSCVLGIWTLLESHIMELLFNISQYVQILSCNMLHLLPISLLLFMANIFESKQQKLVNTICLIDMAIFVLAWVLQLTKIQDFHDTLYLSYISMILVGLICIYIAVIENRQLFGKRKSVAVVSINNKKSNLKVYCVVGFFIAFLIDLISFKINPRNINDMFSRWSAIYSIGVCLGVALHSILQMSKEYNHATAIGKVAYNDVLTGLYNRTAYTEKLNELDAIYNKSKFGIVVFDVNNLKHVNDTMGHNYGDELIMGAANIIKESYSESATIFRVGGDEFIALIEGEDVEKIYKLANIQLKGLMHTYNNTYNKPYHLSIAEGCAIYKPEEGKSVTEVVEEADHKMYISKQEYKKTHTVEGQIK